MRPSREADRRTLLRRLSFDLIGLPPSREEAEQFLNDPRADAYERLVDRLLASPQYGERWGRHWLDVVHFGETHGYDKDKLRPNAWPYRDYVIRSFNRDKPWPRFVEEQLAGDVLFADSPDGIAATGFIAAGPWDYVGHVELPETKTDGLIARYNDRDDMLMTTMSSFQSLTVHCARCHDHKFDPISQKDYYSLQAVFAGVDRANRAYDSNPEVHKARRALLAERRKVEEELKSIDEEIANMRSDQLQRLDRRREALKTIQGADLKPMIKPRTLGYHSQISSAADREKWVQIDLGESRKIDQIILVPAYEIYGGHPGPGFGFPKRFRIEISDNGQFKQPTVVADETAADFPHPGNVPYSVSITNGMARYARVTATKLWLRTGDWIFAMGEMGVVSSGTNSAAGATVTALDSIEAAPNWGARYLVDEVSVIMQSGENKGEWIDRAIQQAQARSESSELESERLRLARSLLDHKTRSRWDYCKTRLADLKQEMGALPRPELVYAATHEFAAEGSFKAANPIRTVHLLSRGDVKRPKEAMKPGVLAVFSDLARGFEINDLKDEGSRRAALAHWLTQPNNLLTRRSVVNRVWQYHFGRGIVETANDFGHMGALPSHPELLDWLACWFQENGESIKRLHRLILTSATYRQTSASRPEFARIDGDNRLLWRMNRRRLEAEAIRDSVLSAAGQLDLRMGGPSIQQFYFKDDHSPVYDYTGYEVNEPGARRRAVYRHIVRSVPDPFMDCLDAADPSLLTPRRNTTLTALQALATLNNPFVLRQAEHFAERLTGSTGDVTSPVRKAYQLALSRPATSAEVKELSAYAKEHGMTNACRLLFNLNEFLFVD